MNPVPLKVLFVVNSLHFGGAEKHVVTLLNSIDTARFTLSLIYLKQQTTLLGQLDTTRLRDGVHCAGVSSKIDLTAARCIAAHIDTCAIDLVVATNTYSLGYSWLARRMARRAPALVEVFHSTELGGWKALLQMEFYRPFFRACELLVYVCNSQRDYWTARRLKAKTTAVVHNGVDTAYFSPAASLEQLSATRALYGFRETDFVVGLCAAMRPEKAHGDLVQAIARLRNAGTDVKALLIGDGPERTKIEAQIAALGLRDVVKISGFLSDVRPQIEVCNLMALVSTNENFSIAALEAMALGKPMVMSQIGGASEQVAPGQNGYLYASGDVEALAQVIRQSMEPGASVRMGELARRSVVEHFSVESMTGKFEQLFARLGATSAKLELPDVRA